jgi:general stress protein 26
MAARRTWGPGSSASPLTIGLVCQTKCYSLFDPPWKLGLSRMDEALRSKILEVLGRQHFMTLATVRPDGYPQATTVNYIHDDLILYFATAATSQKAGNIKVNNKVSVAIVDQAQDFYELRGLSLSGTAARVQESQRAEEFALRLFRRFPQSRRLVPEDPKEVAVYEIRPVAIALVDYASGFETTHLVELWP